MLRKSAVNVAQSPCPNNAATVSCIIGPEKLRKSCARSEQAENCHAPSQRIRQRCIDVVPVKLAVMSSVITMHQESINLYISRWLQAATQQMNIKQYVYITLCILYIFVILALVELLSWLLDYNPRPIHITA